MSGGNDNNYTRFLEISTLCMLISLDIYFSNHPSILLPSVVLNNTVFLTL